MILKFTKMHGIGNDFVVIDAVRTYVRLTPRQIRKIADRHKGVGCDQVLMVLPPDHPENDFKYIIYNNDGSRAGQCGNGARCFARFVRDHGLTHKKSLKVEVSDRVISLHLHAHKDIEVDMGQADLTPESLPMLTDGLSQQEDGTWELDINEPHYQGKAVFVPVSMGNPHIVLLVDDINNAPVSTLGPILESHPAFPERVNVGFLEISSKSEGHLRVFERGAGETLACGSGACAAMFAAHHLGLMGKKVDLYLQGGDLQIKLDDQQAIWMRGSASRSFEGSILL